AVTFDGAELRAKLEQTLDVRVADVQAFELAFATAVLAWQADAASHAERLDLAQRYAAWAVHSADGKREHRRGVLFRAPRKLDVFNLVPIDTVRANGVEALELRHDHALRRREGFALTDRGTDLAGGLD